MKILLSKTISNNFCVSVRFPSLPVLYEVERDKTSHK